MPIGVVDRVRCKFPYFFFFFSFFHFSSGPVLPLSRNTPSKLNPTAIPSLPFAYPPPSAPVPLSRVHHVAHIPSQYITRFRICVMPSHLFLFFVFLFSFFPLHPPSPPPSTRPGACCFFFSFGFWPSCTEATRFGTRNEEWNGECSREGDFPR